MQDSKIVTLYPSKELSGKSNFDSLDEHKEKKPEIVVSGLDNKIDSDQESDNIAYASSILPDDPNSYKEKGDSMSKNFVQLIRSDKALKLLSTNPNAYLLLTYIALHATREDDFIHDLFEGECFISTTSTPKLCGLKSKKLRNAKEKLIKEEFIIETFNPDWMAKKYEGKKIVEMLGKNPDFTKLQKRATTTATKCSIVKLIDSTVFDINIKSRATTRATEGQPEGNIQEEKEEEERIEEESSSKPPSLNSESKKGRKEGNSKFQIIPKVWVNSDELKTLIEKFGSEEIVKERAQKIISDSKRRSAVTFNMLLNWEFYLSPEETEKENELIFKKYQKKIEKSPLWILDSTIFQGKKVAYLRQNGSSFQSESVDFEKQNFKSLLEEILTKNKIMKKVEKKDRRE